MTQAQTLSKTIDGWRFKFSTCIKSFTSQYFIYASVHAFGRRVVHRVAPFLGGLSLNDGPLAGHPSLALGHEGTKHEHWVCMFVTLTSA
jgi:hypothetical protein